MHPRLFLVAALLACSACATAAPHLPVVSSSSSSNPEVASLSSSDQSSAALRVEDFPFVLLLQKNGARLDVKGVGLILTAAGRILTTARLENNRSLFIAHTADGKPGYVCDSLVQIVRQDPKRGTTLLQTIAPVASDCSQGSFIGEWEPLPVTPLPSGATASGAIVYVVVSLNAQDIRLISGAFIPTGNERSAGVNLALASTESLPAGIVFDASLQPIGLTQAMTASGAIAILPMTELSADDL